VKILQVLTQYGTRALDRTFSYLYFGKKEVRERYRVRIDFNGHPAMGFVLKVIETEKAPQEIEQENGYSFKTISENDVIDVEPLLTDKLMAVAEEVAEYYLSPLVSVLQAMLPPSLSPRLSSLNGPRIAYDKYVEFVKGGEEGLTAKQIEMLRLVQKNSPILKKEAGSPSVLEKLIETQKVRIVLKEKQRFSIPESEREVPHEMTLEQRKAYDDILSCDKEVILLQGITGSGKTEVYLRLSEQVLLEGKTVLMLVPEINLTPAMVDYFSRRFGPKVAILHSQLTPGERYDEYRRIANGKAQIVVGARSAVFAPLSHIGLIVLDEEHVESYKQDNAPFYHAREVAIMRGRIEGAKVVLGSATPSLETKARAMRGVYGYASLTHRINEKCLPSTTIVDLTYRANYGKDSMKLSLPLLSKVKEKLERKEQIILLINRRGYWTNIVCASCGHIFTCPSCGGNLTYHQNDEMLKCHHCGYVETFPKVCPECGSSRLMRTGYGTERIVKELNDLFPLARVARLDSDIGQVSKNVEKTIRDFHDGAYDILVGTQMIAKGHDFPNVTLSGVVLADIGLALPTYRAAERTFELIAQAVGRSGRSEKTGEAIIQSFNPSHYAIVYGARQDYEGFFKKEMQERKIAQYPPYVYLILLEFSSANEDKVVSATYAFKKEIESQGIESLDIIGPILPYYALVNGKHKRIILLKFRKRESVDSYLKKLLEEYAGKGGVDISVNVDPLDY
jgi:primosomal protein N' (replication factor Y) (superfamily II helicase)